MTIGASVFLLALGAILHFAVADTLDGVDLSMVGVILMAAGVIGLLVGLYQMSVARRRYVGDPRL